jgi:hypothetical protein
MVWVIWGHAVYGVGFPVIRYSEPVKTKAGLID